MTRTWSELVLANADRERPAVVTATETWTYAELLGRSGGAAEFLAGLPGGTGTPVPGLIEHTNTALALTIGGSFAHRPYAPLGTRLTPAELAAVVQRLGSPVLVSDPGLADLAGRVAALAGVEAVVVPPLRDAPLPALPELDDVAAILHTSGTTGVPKQVVFTQRALAARMALLDVVLGVHPGDTYLVASAFFHVAGFGNAVYTVGVGATVASFPRFSVDAWTSTRDLNITHTLIVPSMIVDLLTAGVLDVHPNMRQITYGASPIHVDVLRQTMQTLPKVELVQMFGQTEGTPITLLTPADHDLAAAGRPELLLSAGRAAPGGEIMLHEPDADGIGEVWARAPHLVVVDDDGWLHSGDLGRLDEDGYLYLVGRLGDTINRGGENVRPLEVENVLRKHPAIADVAVVGLPDRRLGESVAAFVVPDGPLPEWSELRAFARTELAGFKVPEIWHQLDELPRNPSGKVLRRVLAADYAPPTI